MSKSDSAPIVKYYKSLESRLGYGYLLGGNKHFGYYPEKRNTISMRQAMINMQEKLATALDQPEGSHVLDAGCGMGDTALHLARKHKLNVTGIDLLDFNITKANKKKQSSDTAKFMVADYTSTGLQNNTFDAIYTFETLVHAPDYKKALKEFRRLLKPGGKLILFEYSREEDKNTDENTQRAYKIINTYAAMPSFQKFYHGVLERELKASGFVVEYVSDITDFMAPMLRRFWQIAYMPYQLIIRPFKLQSHFINATAGYELYKHLSSFRYNIFVTRKSK